MYKILHLFRDEKFTMNFIKFINNNFKMDYHEIWVYGRYISYTETIIFNTKNVKRVVDISSKLKMIKMNEFDKIIYHGVFDDDIISFFVTNKKFLNKLYLYFWGGDKFLSRNKMDNLKKKYVVRNAQGIINILPEERKYMIKNYKVKGTLFCAMYSADFELLKTIKNEKINNKECVRIQIGNSATKTNNHIDILKKLSRFKDESIEIYVPLSYGNMNYAKRVIKEGRRLFGDKFFPMTELISYEKFKQFSNTIDIAIFDMKRQQALGNIITLIYYGKKVFLRNKSVLYHYFKISKNCDIFTTDEITSMQYDRFISFSNTSKIENGNRVEDLLKLESRIIEWSKIFND